MRRQLSNGKEISYQAMSREERRGSPSQPQTLKKRGKRERDSDISSSCGKKNLPDWNG